jgi:CBS domain-containing protein
MIAHLCSRPVLTASERENVVAVAKRMAEHDVGTVVVITPCSQPVGILTDRDIVKRVVALALDPERVPVSAIMTREVQTVDEATPLERAFDLMAEAQTRRLVVTGKGFQLRGVVSLDDLLELVKAAMPLLALPASLTTCPARSRHLRMIDRTAGSSSTTRMVAMSARAQKLVQCRIGCRLEIEVLRHSRTFSIAFRSNRSRNVRTRRRSFDSNSAVGGGSSTTFQTVPSGASQSRI